MTWHVLCRFVPCSPLCHPVLSSMRMMRALRVASRTTMRQPLHLQGAAAGHAAAKRLLLPLQQLLTVPPHHAAPLGVVGALLLLAEQTVG